VERCGRLRSVSLAGVGRCAGSWQEAGSPLWKRAVGAEIQPLLLGYFKLNDWQKMNGSIGVKVSESFRWHAIALGSGGETLKIPMKPI